MNKLIPGKARRFNVCPAEQHEFGILDKRSRQIGAAIVRFSVEVTETPGCNGYGVLWYRQNQIGIKYLFCFHATRDGIHFGASHSDQWFATEAEREDGIRKYLQNAKARAAKARRAKAT
jgi:hypothetical protein